CKNTQVPFRLGMVPSTLKVQRDKPFPPEGIWEDKGVAASPPVRSEVDSSWRKGAIELCRNEEEAVQLVIGQNDRELKNVKITVSDLKGTGDAVIPASSIKIRPLGYVKTEPSGIYLTERDGWFADVLLEIDTFNLPPETPQPIWISFRAGSDTKPGTYTGSITVGADGISEKSIPFFTIHVYDFELPVAHSLPVLMWGGTHLKAHGYEKGSPEAKALAAQHEDLLFAHRMVPGWHTRKFDWNRATLPRNEDGTFDFTEYDATVERLMKKGMTRFMIGHAPRLGKWGFPDHFSEQWKKNLAEFITAMTAHLKEKGWLENAIYYSIDEAARKEWPSCKMIYKLIKDIEPDLTILQTLNEPKATQELSKFADIINVNVRQYYKARVPELQKEGLETWWYVCCWPNENPNLFIEYPGIDPRIIGWMTWKYKTTGMVYWQTMAWGKAFDNMGGKKYIDTIKSKWNTVSFGRYNGDGNLFYPGPDGKILCTMRLEGYRDGLEDYEYLMLLKRAVEAGKLEGPALERAKQILKIDDTICDLNFNYELTGETMRKVRREIARILEGVE
ncbi:glycoside hydrolase domain-containing protein, partial [Planctomycetota bacterium]